jgi:DNA-binding transcriptional MerR regulator
MAAIAAEPEVKYKKKLFHRVNEVSRITGLKPYVLRYWETEFPQLSPEKDDNDQRRYRQSDIDVILRIKHLLYSEKLTIADAKQQFGEVGAPARKTASARKTAASKAAPKRPARPGKRASSSAPRGGLLGEIATIRGELHDLLAFLS